MTPQTTTAHRHASAAASGSATALLADPPPTNRHRKGVNFADRHQPWRGAGFDTIRLTGPASPRALKAFTGRGRTAQITETGRTWANVDPRRGEPYATFEFNVPKFFTEVNDVPGTLSQCHEAVQTIHAALDPEVGWRVDWPDLQLLRLDLNRDFAGVVSAHSHLEALASIPADRADTHLYLDDLGRGCQTLYRQTDRWKARLYVKSEHETPNVASYSTVRYELELKGSHLRDQRRKTFITVDEPFAREQLEKYFRRCRFGAPVAPYSLKLRQLEAYGLDAGLIKKVVGQLAWDADRGLEQTTNKTILKHRRIAVDAGLTPALFRGHVTGSTQALHSQQLDLQQGCRARAS